MRKLDLAAKKAPEPTPDPMDAVYEASAPSEPEPAPALTSRVALLRFRVRNPETGGVEVIELESTAPDSGARLKMGQAAVRLAGGTSLQMLAAGDSLYATCLARIGVQCSEIPKDKRWILSDPTNVVVLAEALIDHDQRYFRGELAEDGGATFTPVVERPWTRADPANAGAVG